MKLSWKDVATTLLVLAGGAVVYAKFYDFSWSIVQSWRMAVGSLVLVGLLMFIFSSFDFANRSILNLGEMMVGALAIGLGVTGMVFNSSPIFYSLAVVLGALWLVDTARHARHSLLDSTTTTTHHAASVH